MKMLKKIIVLVVAFISLACGWDWDTIQMERQQFPQIHELITGKFLRHSPELYYWRIKDRTKRLAASPDSVQLYDDLAMAYDKTGESNKAVDVMLEKEKKKPGLYETYANLGLFYMHAGDMKNGVLYVQKALKVNPNAHFGREKYQLYLGKYILQQMQNDSLSLPMTKGNVTGFYNYLQKIEFKNKDYKSEEHFKELSNAIKGVSGMMTFANYRSPVLLEALADLLLHTNSVRGAGHLASRAYMKASLETDGKTAKAYYEKAKWAREYTYTGRMWDDHMIEQFIAGREEKRDTLSGKGLENPLYNMEALEAAVKLEVQDAEMWFDSLRRDEISWIKTKKNPDSAFAAKYYNVGELRSVGFEETYAYGKRANVDNAAWLALQLTKPAYNGGMPAYTALPDSVKSMIDALYKEEAKAEDVKETTETVTPEENPQGSNSFLMWLLVLIPVLGVFYYFKFKRRIK